MKSGFFKKLFGKKKNIFKLGNKIQGEIIAEYGNGYYLVDFGEIKQIAYSSVKLSKKCTFEVASDSNPVQLKIASEEIEIGTIKQLIEQYPNLKKLPFEDSVHIIKNLKYANKPINEECILHVYDKMIELDITSDNWLPLIVRLIDETGNLNDDFIPALKSIFHLYSPNKNISSDSLFILEQLYNILPELFFSADKKANYLQDIKKHLEEKTKQFMPNAINKYRNDLQYQVPIRWYRNILTIERNLGIYSGNKPSELFFVLGRINGKITPFILYNFYYMETLKENPKKCFIVFPNIDNSILYAKIEIINHKNMIDFFCNNPEEIDQNYINFVTKIFPNPIYNIHKIDEDSNRFRNSLLPFWSGNIEIPVSINGIDVKI